MTLYRIYSIGEGHVTAESPEAAAETWIQQFGQCLSGEDIDPVTQKFPDAELEQDVLVIDTDTNEKYTFTYAVNGWMEYRRVR